MQHTFTAGRVREIAGVTREQMLSFESKGLIRPRRNGRNHRIFTPEDVRRVLEITGAVVRKRIAVVNQKGGVGKTTTVFNLAPALLVEGRRVLAVDLDAQANLTVSFGKSPDDLSRTSHDLLVDDEVPAAETIAATEWEGLDLIPGDIRLASADLLLREMIMRERILATKLEPVLDRYDIVIFDCPPNLSTITINALVAATDVIMPMETQLYSVKAVEDLTKTFRLLASRMNHHLDVRVLPTKIDRRVKMTGEFLASMEESFAGRMLTPIRTDAKLAKAPIAKEPAIFAFPNSRGAKDYRRLAREVLHPPAEDVSPN